jgi:hypothetical protein
MSLGRRRPGRDNRRVTRAIRAASERPRIRRGPASPVRAGARAFWQDVPIPRSCDICLLRPPSLPRGERFETLSNAARIDDANIARLLNFRPDLAAEIERGDEDGECASLPISARAARRYRRYFIAELLRIAEEREGPHQTATLYMRAFQDGELEAADLKLELEVLRKTLQRSDFEGSIMVGGTEIAWLARHKVWILHCHLLAIGVLQADWARLRKLLPDASPGAALKVKPLKDFAEQVSYCQKFNSSHKPGKRGPDGRAPARPLPTERLIEWAEWMARQRFEDFAFLWGARRRGGRIVVES